MKNLIKNKILLIFMLLVIVGIMIRFTLGEDSFLWKLYATLDTASAVALAVLAFFGYLEYSKSEDTIRIYFKVDNQKQIDTGLSILRKNFSRSEVFGLLGMIQKDASKRFDIQYSRDITMLDTIHKIQKVEKDNFIIYVTKKELEQFNIKESL